MSPAYGVSSEHSGDSGAPDLEAKPLLALLTALVLAGLWHPLILPAPCGPEILRPVLPSSVASNHRYSSETEGVVPSCGVFEERVRR